MAVPPDLASQVLSLCARHCCICRRFRPTQLQVHHIREKNQGGTDELPNLIAICVSCHSDVHSNTLLTRRFTEKELVLHREAVYELVSQGRLPAPEVTSDALAQLSASMIAALRDRTLQSDDSSFPLSIRSLDILLSAAALQKPILVDRMHGISIHVGPYHYIQSTRSPAHSSLPDPLIKLATLKLIEGTDDEFFITSAGMVFADDVLAANPSFTMVKAKCLACSMHFSLCTWDPERHDEKTLYCPECGQHQGGFLVWKQRMFGFIFQTVPGIGQALAGTTHDLKRRQ